MESSPLKKDVDYSRKVLILVGPTASGKTSVSILLAQFLDGEILSADSRQIYKYLNIGTAKPSQNDLHKVKHYFIDELSPEQDFNAAEFGKKGREIIDDILKRGKTPIVVGGSGLYIQALVDGFFDGPSADPEIRERFTQRMKLEGAEKLLEELRKVDPVSASKMVPGNKHRIIRALEVFEITGQLISSLHKESDPADFKPCFVGLQWDRKKLYERINLRVDQMLEGGFLDEVRSIKEKGFSSGINALQTVGYKEAFEYLSGNIEYTLMVELFKRNTRRYAKRQLTWFRADDRITWFPIDNEEQCQTIADKIMNHFSQF